MTRFQRFLKNARRGRRAEMMHDGVKHIASSIGDPGDVAPITPQMVNFALGMLNWINETPDGGVRERQFLAPIAHLFKEPNDNTSQE